MESVLSRSNILNMENEYWSTLLHDDVEYANMCCFFTEEEYQEYIYNYLSFISFHDDDEVRASMSNFMNSYVWALTENDVDDSFYTGLHNYLLNKSVDYLISWAQHWTYDEED